MFRLLFKDTVSGSEECSFYLKKKELNQCQSKQEFEAFWDSSALCSGASVCIMILDTEILSHTYYECTHFVCLY